MSDPTFPGWDILEKLGEGGMCAVYRVRPSSGEGVERAAKVLLDRSPHAIDRFVAEGRLLQTIDHPNVVKVHEIHDADRPPWLVMDLLAGRDLDEIVEQEGAMDPERCARLYADVASGLAAVHALDIRHRDIKPANIMLGHDGIPRLIDFGIARETSRKHVTQKGFLVGTAAYLPPEVFTGEDAHNAQDNPMADVYALGQSLCESLTGKLVHPAGDTPNLLMAIMTRKLEAPSIDPREWRPGVPAELCAVVMAATMQEPERRIQTAKDLEHQLRDWLAARAQVGVHAAPLNRVDPANFPAPPTPAGVQRRTGRTAEMPVPRNPTSEIAAGGGGAVRTAGAAALSATGLGLVLAGITAATLVGVVLLWVARPQPPIGGAGGKAKSAIAEALDKERSKFLACKKPGVSGEVVVRAHLTGGHARDITLERTTVSDRTVADCVVKAVSAAKFPTRGDQELSIRLPVQFK